MKPQHNPFLRQSRAFAAASALFVLGTSGTAHAVDYIWSGATGNWTDTTWTPGPITGPTANTDTATINSGGYVTINSQTIDSAIAINSGATVVANAVANTANVTLGGNLTGAGTLTKAGSWSLLLGGDNSGFSGTINASSANILFTADSAGSAAADWVITAGNVVNNQSGTGRVIKLGSLAGHTGNLGSNSSDSEVTFEIGGNGKSTDFSGQIVNTPPSWGGGTVSLTKVGGGTLTLSGNNTYTGTTKVNDGILALQGAGSGGTTYNGGNLSINGPSTLRVTGTRYNFSGKTFAFDSVGGGTIDAVANGAGGFVFTGSNNFTTSGGAQNTISGTRIGAENQGLNLNGQTAIFEVVTGTDATSDLKVTGTIWGGGSVIKNGAGRMEISAAQQYTGTTTVNAGKLIVNGNISTSSLTTVSGSGTLGGSGTVGAVSVLAGGTFAPGNSIDSLDIAGALTLGANSFSVFEINTAGNISDLAIVSGLLTFGGTLNVNNVGATLVNGDTFDLFNWGTKSGTFSAVNLPALDSGLTWDDTALYTNGTITVIPEPRAALLGSLGLLALLRRRR